MSILTYFSLNKCEKTITVHEIYDDHLFTVLNQYKEKTPGSHVVCSFVTVVGFGFGLEFLFVSFRAVSHCAVNYIQTHPGTSATLKLSLSRQSLYMYTVWPNGNPMQKII